MKTILCRILTIFLFVTMIPISSWSLPRENPLDITEEVVFTVNKYFYKVGGQPLIMDATPIWNEQRQIFLIPLRSYADLLRYEVQWDEKEKLATISNHKNILKISLESGQGCFNDETQNDLYFEIRFRRIVLDALTLSKYFSTPFEIISEKQEISFTVRRLDVLMKAEDFTLPVLNGDKFSLYEQLEREEIQLVAINFYSTFCPFCIKEIPNLVRFDETYRDKGVLLIGIDTSTTDTLGRREQILEQYGVDYPILIDLYSKIYDLYRVSGIPNIFIINKEKEIVLHHLGVDDHFFAFLYHFVDAYLEQ